MYATSLCKCINLKFLRDLKDFFFSVTCPSFKGWLEFVSEQPTPLEVSMAQLASAKQAIPPTEDLLQVYNQKQIRSEEVKSNLIHTRTRVRSPLQGSPYSAEEYQTAQLKKSQNFLGSVGYRTILAKHLTSFVFAAQHHLFHKQNIPCDAIMESSFPWQHYWIPLRGRFWHAFFRS